MLVAGESERGAGELEMSERVKRREVMKLAAFQTPVIEIVLRIV